MAITVEAKESAGLDAGMYSGKIVEVLEETGQYGEQIKFVIDIEDLYDNDGKNRQQWAWASKTLTPKSKLQKWLKNVCGQTPQVGQNFDIEGAFLGASISFMVSINETGRSVVTDIVAQRGAAAPAARPAPIQQAAPAPSENSDPCAICGAAAGDEEMVFTAAGAYIHARHNN